MACLPTPRSGKLLPVKPLPEVPVSSEPAVAGSRGKGLLVSRGSLIPEDPVSAEPEWGTPSTPDLMLVVDAASLLMGILEVEDGLFIPEVVVPAILDPRGPVDVLLPNPEVVLDVGFVDEERGLFAPVVLLPRWLPWPVVAPVVPVEI